MMENVQLSKVGILIQQKKYSEAEKILIDLLSREPNYIPFLYLLAEVYLQQDQFEKATQVVDGAIGQSPDTSQLFYLKSRIFIQQNNFKEAENQVNEAIRLNAYDADYFALLGNIQLCRKQFQEALKTADKALEIDAENLSALNVRSTALNKLNRKEEAFATIEGALREDPNNAYTHANYGWSLLEKGNHKKALEHFKEALKNDPTSNYAQAGMLETIKASNPAYRIFLKYAFWMGNLAEKYQWMVIIGLFLAIRILNRVAQNNDAIEPFLTPIIIILVLFVFSTWVVTPISNLFLRFNRYGQLLLNKKEKMSSNFVAGSLAVFLAGLLLFFALPDERFIAVAFFGFAMMLPCGVMFTQVKYKNFLLFYTVGLAVSGVSAIVLTFLTYEIFNVMTSIFMVGFIAFQWVANIMIAKSNN